jgi:hypothetical protein
MRALVGFGSKRTTRRVTCMADQLRELPWVRGVWDSWTHGTFLGLLVLRVGDGFVGCRRDLADRAVSSTLIQPRDDGWAADEGHGVSVDLGLLHTLLAPQPGARSSRPYVTILLASMTDQLDNPR